MTLIDLFFNCVIVYALGVLLRVVPHESEAYFRAALGFYLVKTAVWLLMRIPLMFPIDEWERRGASPEDNTPSLVRAISYFPFHFTLLYGALLGIFYTAFMAWMVYGPGPIKLGPDLMLPGVMLAGSVCAGAIAIGVPVNLILTARLSRRLAERSVLSFEQIPGRELSLRAKMATIALALGCAPSLLLFSVQSFVQDHGLYQEAERGADVVMKGLAFESPDGFARWALSEHTYPFWVEGGRLEFHSQHQPPAEVAAALEQLRPAENFATVDRRHRFVVRMATRQGGIQGVVVQVPDPQNDWVALSIVILLASFWPLLTASLLVRTIVIPISTIASTFHRIIGRGRTEDSDRVPIFYKDEVGRLAFNANRTIDTLTEARGQLEVTATNLAQKNRELESAYRTKGEFLANMSHELRTPLNAIIGFSRLMKRKLAGTLPERQAKNLELIQQSGEQLLTLVNDLLDFEKIEAGKLEVRREEIELAPLLDALATTLEPSATEKGLRLVFDTPKEPVRLHSDKERLRQVLTNLVTNAIKYSDVGTVTLRAAVNGDRLVITVSDQGIGMTDEQMSNIFDPFHQVDASQTRERGGVGLGLAIVARLMGLLQGSIEVSSVLGEGSTFTVSFPLGDGTSYLLSKPFEFEELKRFLLAERSHGIERGLMIVEDDSHTGQLLCQLFEESGIAAMLFTNESQAKDQLSKSLPAVLVLDLSLEDGSGWAVLTYLRGLPESQQTRVFVYTAADLSSEEQARLKASFATVVTKHGQDSLSELVSAVIGKASSSTV